jgi:hypothetical protein
MTPDFRLRPLTLDNIDAHHAGEDDATIRLLPVSKPAIVAGICETPYDGDLRSPRSTPDGCGRASTVRAAYRTAGDTGLPERDLAKLMPLAGRRRRRARLRAERAQTRRRVRKENRWICSTSPDVSSGLPRSPHDYSSSSRVNPLSPA